MTDKYQTFESRLLDDVSPIFSIVYAKAAAKAKVPPIEGLTAEVEAQVEREILCSNMADKSVGTRLLELLKIFSPTAKKNSDVALTPRDQYFNAVKDNLQAAWADAIEKKEIDPVFLKRPKLEYLLDRNNKLESLVTALADSVTYDGLKLKYCAYFSTLLKTIPQGPFNAKLADFLQRLMIAKTPEEYKSLTIIYVLDTIKNPSPDLLADPKFNDPKIKKQLFEFALDIFAALSTKKGDIPNSYYFDENQKQEAKEKINDGLRFVIKIFFQRSLAEIKAKVNKEHGTKYERVFYALKEKLDASNTEDELKGYVNNILVQALAENNIDIQKDLGRLLLIQDFSIHDNNYNFTKNNLIIYTKFTSLNVQVKQRFAAYKKQRSGFFNSIRDFFNRVVGDPEETIEGRKNLVTRLEEKLPNLAACFSGENPIETVVAKYKDFSEGVSAKLIGVVGQGIREGDIKDDSSPLKGLLKQTQEFVTRTTNEVLGVEISGISELNDLNNARFNGDLVKEFEKYQADRKESNIFKAIWKVGLFKAINEISLSNDSKKTLRINTANVFKGKIESCKTAQDYFNYIFEACHTIDEIYKGGDDDSGLVALLEKTIDDLAVRFLFKDSYPEFTLKQKILIIMANEKVRGDHFLVSPFINKLKGKIIKEIGEANFETIKATIIKEDELKARMMVAQSHVVVADREAAGNISDKNVKVFEEVVHDRLFSSLLGSKSIVGGDIAAKSGKEAKIGGYIQQLGSAGNALGVPAVGTIGTVCNTLAQYIDSNNRAREHGNASKLFKDCRFLDNLTRSTVDKIKLRYIEQIRKIATNVADSSAVQVLANCAAQRIIQYIKDGKVEIPDNEIEDKLIEVISNQLVNAVKINRLSHSTIPFIKTRINIIVDGGPDEWDIEDIFAEPGYILIPEGGEAEFYSKNGLEPKYGYILARDSDEIKLSNMQKVPADQAPQNHPAVVAYQNAKKYKQAANVIQNPVKEAITNEKLKTELAEANLTIAELRQQVASLFKKLEEAHVAQRATDVNIAHLNGELARVLSLLERLLSKESDNRHEARVDGHPEGKSANNNVSYQQQP